MDAEFEITILNYCLKYLFKNNKINSKKITDIVVDAQQWDNPNPEFIVEIRNRIRGMKKGIGLIYSKKLRIEYIDAIYRKSGNKYISMGQITNVIKDPYRFVEFEPLGDGSYAICYTRKDKNNVIVTHEGISNCKYGSGIRGGYFIISKKLLKEIQKRAKANINQMKQLDQIDHTDGGHGCITDSYPWEFLQSWKIHKTRELQTIHSILNEVDDGFEYIMNKLDEFEYKKYENPHKSYKKFMKDQDD